MARKPSLPGTHTVLFCETERLRIRHFTEDDAAFILRLLNEPSFIRHIADKGMRTLDDAVGYLRKGPWPAACDCCGQPRQRRVHHLLEKLGFTFEKMVRLAADEPEIRQFAVRLPLGVSLGAALLPAWGTYRVSVLELLQTR